MEHHQQQQHSRLQQQQQHSQCPPLDQLHAQHLRQLLRSQQRQKEEEKQYKFSLQQFDPQREEWGEAEQQRAQPKQGASTVVAQDAPSSLPVPVAAHEVVPSACAAAAGDFSKSSVSAATAAPRKRGGHALEGRAATTGASTFAAAAAAAAAFFLAAFPLVSAQPFTALPAAADRVPLALFGVEPAEPGSAAARAALAASAAQAVQRLRRLDLMHAAAPSGVINLSHDSYNSLFLGFLPPPLPPAADFDHPPSSSPDSATAATAEEAAAAAARRRRMSSSRRRRRSLYFATWRRAPPRPFHLFVLFTFLLPSEVRLRVPFPNCPECADAFRAFERISQAYKQLAEKKPTRRSWWRSPQKRGGDSRLSAIPSSSEEDVPVFFAVANVALLRHTPAFHGLPSLPAVVYVPPTSPRKIDPQQQQQKQMKKKKGKRQQEQQQQKTEGVRYDWVEKGNEEEEGEEGEEEETREEDDLDLLEDEEASRGTVHPVKRMQAAAPSPFPRSDLLMLQRVTADAGMERAILEWVNMKTKWAVDLPLSVWTDGRSLCVLMAFLVVLLLLARLMVSLLPRYPWLLPAAACIFYWLSTSGLVFSLYNRVPLYGVDTQSGRRVFIAPGRSQFFLEGFLMSGCSVLVAAAGTALIYLPSSLRLYSRQAVAAAAAHRRRALQALANFIDADKASRCISNTGSGSHTERRGICHTQSGRKNICSSSGCHTGQWKDGEVQNVLRYRSRDASATSSSKSEKLDGAHEHCSSNTVSLISAAAVKPTEQGRAAAVGIRGKGKQHYYHTDETEFDELLLGLVEADRRERCLRMRSGLHASERMCLTILLVVTALIFVGAASIEFQGFRYKSPWYKSSFFPAPEYLRGPMRVDRGNAF